MRTKEKDSALTDLVLGHLSPEEALKVIARVERDPELSNHLDELIELARVADEGGVEIFELPATRKRRAHDASWGRGVADIWRSAGWNRGIPVLASVFGICLFLLPLVSELNSHEFDSEAIVEVSDFDTQIRGGEIAEIQRAQAALNDRQFDEAIRILRWTIHANSGIRSTEFAEYLLGGTYLARARTTVLGLFPRYDTLTVRQGVVILGTVSRNSRLPRLAQEARFLRAKGLMVLGDREGAIDELATVVVLGGPRQFDAMDLLDRISPQSGEDE